MQIDKAASIAVVVRKTWANLHRVNMFLRPHPDPQADIRGVDESHILFAKVLDPDDPGVWIELTGDKQNADCAVGRVSLLVRWSQVLTIVIAGQFSAAICQEARKILPKKRSANDSPDMEGYHTSNSVESAVPLRPPASDTSLHSCEPTRCAA